MKLGQLLAIQNSGALKVVVDNESGNITLGGVPVTLQQCDMMAGKLGWVHGDMRSYALIEKEDKFLRQMSKYMDNANLAAAEVTFMNRRISDTMKYFDRITMVGPDFNITILYRMPGVGGVYAVYDKDSNSRQPDFTCRSMKQLMEFLNEAV